MVEISLLGSERARVGNHLGYSTSRGLVWWLACTALGDQIGRAVESQIRYAALLSG